MRLLHTKTLQFSQFLDSEIPTYAILSHRWETAPTGVSREIELDAFQSDYPTLSSRRAIPKIGTFCTLARAHGFDWAWVDTCCIDKKSSAELTEAINSMYAWYRGARRCYVYFNDVEWDPDDVESSRDRFKASRWFTRGWTLQELLAPRFLECYDRYWRNFGDRDSLAEDISAATGISFAHLKTPTLACVAVKMSWAAKRETSRVEDMAYCLLGLFGINMPMLYGEGRNAFLRLQRKLIKKTDDESIFAWNDKGTVLPHGMLAPWPNCFAGCSDVVATTDPEVAVVRRPYTITNRGLELYVSLPSDTKQGGDGDGRASLHPFQTLTLGLNCERRSATHGEDRYLTIKLHNFGKYWQRVECNAEFVGKPAVENTFQDGGREWPADSLSEMRTIYVKQDG